MKTPDQHTEQRLQDAGLTTAPRITPDDIEAIIESKHFFTAADGVRGATPPGLRVDVPDPALARVTICVLVLLNGTQVVGVNEGPVSPENHSPMEGRIQARQKAIDQIWPMLGYELRTKLARAAADALAVSP